jgi:branched-subunit amino acid aminotransferase/4-amino-4-deoxychorismate lyase
MNKAVRVYLYLYYYLTIIIIVKELVTPPLEDGLILPGVTRDSILTLAREWVRTNIIR